MEGQDRKNLDAGEFGEEPLPACLAFENTEYVFWVLLVAKMSLALTAFVGGGNTRILLFRLSTGGGGGKGSLWSSRKRRS